MPLDPKRLKHLQETGLVVGALLVLLNWFALVSPFLSSPLFLHPVGIVVGAVMCFFFVSMLAGAGHDGNEAFDRDGFYDDHHVEAW